jgi:hypothetical protein
VTRNQGRTNPGRQVAWATKFCIMEPNFVSISVYNFQYKLSKSYSFEVDARILENLYNHPLKNINKSIKLKILVILYRCFVYFDGGVILRLQKQRTNTKR